MQHGSSASSDLAPGDNQEFSCLSLQQESLLSFLYSQEHHHASGRNAGRCIQRFSSGES